MKIKENILKERLKQLGSAAIAFSGGVDSTYLLSVASEVLREKVIAVTANAKSSSPWEIEEAEEFCKSIGVKHFVESVDEFTLSGYAENPPNRCYICKKGIFSKIFEVAKKNGIYYVGFF